MLPDAWRPLVSVVLVTCLGQVPTTKPKADAEPPAIGPGTKRPLVAARGFVPLLNGEAAYRKFTAAVHTKDLGDLRALAIRHRVLSFARPGQSVEVVAVHIDRDPGRASFLPAAEVRGVGGGRLRPDADPADTFWVPLASLRGSEDGPLDGEDRLPSFVLVPGARAEAVPGAVMALYGKGRVAITKDILAYESYIRSALAKDMAGIRVLEKSGRLVWVESPSRVLILERHENRFIGKGVPAIEARVLDGDHAGETFWAPESSVCFLYFKVVAAATPKAAEKRKAPAKPKGRP
jgi:hypothetical protein